MQTSADTGDRRQKLGSPPGWGQKQLCLGTQAGQDRRHMALTSEYQPWEVTPRPLPQHMPQRPKCWDTGDN